MTSPRWIDAHLFLAESRVYQLAMRGQEWAVAALNLPDPRKRWCKNQCAFWDDPRLPEAFGNYESNLVEICRYAEQAGAKTVLCTIPANMRNWMPIFSRNRPDPAERGQGAPSFHYHLGASLRDAGDHVSAIDHLLQVRPGQGGDPVILAQSGILLVELEPFLEGIQRI